MRQSLTDSRRPEWQICSVFVRHRDGPRRLEQAIRLLLEPAQPSEASPPPEGRSNHARSHLRPRLDGSPGARPDD
jgi:hypothetical protein